MMSAMSIFDELQHLVIYAKCNGIEPKKITLCPSKTREWEKACAEYQGITVYDPNPTRSFCGIPVEIDSPVIGISVG